ncbi:hypothetical protein SDC9_98036 [bioreactor metagenome]|uniref:Uncharacterized protein n=1 Tax=bioreactor metagenome TaxID=1076179 RepID=A0A645AF03_9ZZZZ
MACAAGILLEFIVLKLYNPIHTVKDNMINPHVLIIFLRFNIKYLLSYPMDIWNLHLQYLQIEECNVNFYHYSNS